ncbi:hypothetical protein L208DRAFT_1108988, partial [Tricholoma matsutake]
IKSADLNSPDVSEDDSGPSWGHHQFTSGAMTIKSVLSSWECVGSTDTARVLIAAAIKTCKVAHIFCWQKKIQTSSYFSDVYLQEIVEMLWMLW